MNKVKLIKRIPVVFIAWILSACSNSELDSELDALIKYHRLSSSPVADATRQTADIRSAKAQLGKHLFFSTALSGNDDVACASCHHPLLGGDDDLPLSVGVSPTNTMILGKNRIIQDNQPLVARNAPTTFNSGLWQKTMFHDGRVERLNPWQQHLAKISTPDVKYGDEDLQATSLVQAQAGFPVTSQDEMRDNYKDTSSNQTLRYFLANKIIQEAQQNTDHNWQQLFANIYPQDAHKPLNQLITFKRIQDLLGEYEKSQLFIDNPWFAYLKGDKKALSENAKRGAILFYKSVEQGGAGCVSCHTGALFSDEKFHILAVPHAGEGKDTNGDDTGRFLRTGIYDDRYAFRTPSLLNVSITAPYGHNGTFADLKSIIQHHLNPEKSVQHYDFVKLKQMQKGLFNENSLHFTQVALTHLKRAKRQGRSLLKTNHLNTKKIGYLVQFLNSLTDPCTLDKRCLSPWLPEPQEKVQRFVLE